MKGSSDVHFALLGPLRADDGERACTPRRAKLRDLLALLLVSADQEVSRESLINDLWAGHPPSSAVPALQVYVSQLRQALCPGVAPDAPEQLIQTVAHGYRIAIDTRECDLLQFEDAACGGIAALEAGDAATATEILRAALALWRGPAFSDITLPVIRDVHAPQLEERRLAVLGCRIDADLELGRHAELLDELAGLILANPFNERFAGQLMRAQLACGDPAEAAETFRGLSVRLREGLGLEPGAQVRALLQDAGADTGKPMAWQSPAQLPRDLPDFTGRVEAVKAVTAAMCGNDAAPCLITGPAGAGKTSLAVHAAHAVRDHFPDGQLFVDLRGFESKPLDPARVLGNLLADLGMDRRFIPKDTDERSELFRSRLAGRRILLVLDNAGSLDQIRPLLPDRTGCHVLATSRSGLVDWTDTARVSVDALDLSESLRLLTRILGDDRVAAEPDAAGRIVDSCGRLPLAVRIAATRLSVRKHWTLGQFAARLDNTKTRLDELVAGDLEVRASMAVTYHSCAERERQVLQALSTLRIPDFPGWLAAAFVDVDLAEGQRVVDRLVEVNLLRVVRQDAVGQVRYQFHDLVRVFARSRLEAESSVDARRAAAERVIGACVALADRAETLGEPGRLHRLPLPEIPWSPFDRGLGGLVDADPLGWLTTETDSLIDAVKAAHAFGLDQHAAVLADRLSWYFYLRSGYDAWSSTLATGIASAKRIGDRRAEAALLVHSGALSGELQTTPRHSEDAIELYRQAWQISNEIGDDYGAAEAQLGMSRALLVRGATDEAERLLETSAPVFDRRNDVRAQAKLKRVQGMLHHYRGRFDECADCFATSARLFAYVGDFGNRAVLMADLARARMGQGRFAEAVALFAGYIPQLEAAGNIKQAVFWQAFEGDALRAQGETEAAEAVYRRCIEAADRIGHWWARGLALIGLGELRIAEELYDEAERFLDESVESFRDSKGDPRRAAHAQLVLGRLHLAKGEHAEALDAFDAAEAGFTALGITYLAGRARDALAEARTRSPHAAPAQRRRNAGPVQATSPAARGPSGP